MMTSEVEQFIGRIYTFDDGASLKVIQVKRRDDGFWVTYETNCGGGLPKRHSTPEVDFISQFAHLFV